MQDMLKRAVTAPISNALHVNGVSHTFGSFKALDDVSLEVERGSFTVLLGPNGAGKSTLFSLITRLYDNVTGSIDILGADIRRQPTLALRRLGVVFQSRTLDADLTLAQNLYYHAKLHGFSGSEARERGQHALKVVGLSDRSDAKVRELSGGQARRVEIARSLLHRPALLLLDEPTVGLDIASREGVVKIVRDLVQHENLGVLWATHLIDEIEDTDRIVVLHNGKILFAGTVPGLLEHAGEKDIRAAFNNLTGVNKRAAA